jgi:hypothetical protein
MSRLGYGGFCWSLQGGYEQMGGFKILGGCKAINSIVPPRTRLARAAKYVQVCAGPAGAFFGTLRPKV